MSLTSCTGEDLRRNPEITEPRVCSCPGGLQVGLAWPARGLFFLTSKQSPTWNHPKIRHQSCAPCFFKHQERPRQGHIPSWQQSAETESSCQRDPEQGPGHPQTLTPMICRPPEALEPVRTPCTPFIVQREAEARREACPGSHSRSMAEPG